MKDFLEVKKRRNEIFQMAMLEPAFAILDETDSGLDIDALKNSCKRRQHKLKGKRQCSSSNYSLPAIVGLYSS